MALFDTLDSLMMTHLYTSKAASAEARAHFNIAVTCLTAIIALAVGTIYLAGLMQSALGVGLLAPIAGLSEHFEWMGYLIVVVYSALWLLLLMRSRSPSQSSAMTSANPSPTRTP